MLNNSMPRFNNSAMDGYGVKLVDANKIVSVNDTILAGSQKTTQMNQHSGKDNDRG